MVVNFPVMRGLPVGVFLNLDLSAFWRLNAETLRGQYPRLLEDLFREDDAAEPPQDIVIEASAQGVPVLKADGRYVHSPRDPAREARRLVEAAGGAGGAGGADGADGGTAENSAVILLGFALGYAAEAAAELFPQRPLIIVEKSRRMLKAAFETRDLRALLSRRDIAFVCGASSGAVTQALSFFEKSRGEKNAPLVIRNRVLAELDAEWYAAVEGHIRTWNLRDEVNSATHKKFGKRWVRNLARNMSAIRDLPGISRLAGLAAADGEAAAPPVFLAAAGPGLDSAGPLLRDIHRRCIIVAVDTSLRFFMRHGVEPDFALVVDPQFWNSRHLDRSIGKRVRLIAESAVYPPVFRLPFRAAYLCGSLFPLGTFIEKRVDPKGLLGAGGSVATTAWDFARSIGARDIWIAGLDLAFPAFKTHFSGALFEERALSESNRKNPAETWLVRALQDGSPFYAPAAEISRCPASQVLTDRRLSLYAAWFENRFRRYPEIRNRSLSSGGLAIAGLENVSAESFLALPDRRKEIDRRLDAAFSRIEADFFEPEETRRRAERYCEAAAALRSGLERIKTAAERGSRIAEDALKRGFSPALQRETLAKLDEVTRLISESAVKEAAGFLFPPQETPLNEKNTKKTGADAFRAFLESSLKLYRPLAQAAAYHLQILHGKTSL
jgi:hypothetical protein